jgi:hypothetical protein
MLIVYGRNPWEVLVRPITSVAGKTEVKVKPYAVPQIENASPIHFGFAHWDGDGKFDLLAAVRPGGENASCGIYWYRDISSKGEPKFAAAERLLTIPAPWGLVAFAVVDWDQDGRLGLVVSVTRDGKAEGGAAILTGTARIRRSA